MSESQPLKGGQSNYSAADASRTQDAEEAKGGQLTQAEQAQLEQLGKQLEEALQSYPRTPTTMQCPTCGKKGMTETEVKSGNCNYITCCLCCLFGCCLGCCLIPFCINDLKDVHHHCSACKSLIVKVGYSGTRVV